MPVSILCSSAYSTLLTAFCLAYTPVPFGVPSYIAYEPKTNVFLSNVVSGGYARETVARLLEDTRLTEILPLDIFAFDEEVTDFFERESSRYARHALHEGVGYLGLSGNLSLASSSSVYGFRPASNRSSRRTRLRARVSSRRLGLSLIFRF